MNIKIKDPISALTHFIGAVLSVFGTMILVKYVEPIGTYKDVISVIVYGISLILLYTASTVYHWSPAQGKVNRILRKLDHMMIYVLIAGTYTPICMISLSGKWRWGLLISIWVLAVGGIILKALWMDVPRWISTTIYILMGWLVVLAFFPLKEVVSIEGVGWLIGGGIFYTVGAIIYGLKWPKFKWRGFGFHELFHLFVMAGSACHFWMIFKYVIGSI